MSLRRTIRALIGASLWIYLGWDAYAYHSTFSLTWPADWILIPLGFYLVAGAYLVVDGVQP